MIDQNIYKKALDLRDRLLKDFSGYTHDLVISYVLTEAIEEIKKEYRKENLENEKDSNKKDF